MLGKIAARGCFLNHVYTSCSKPLSLQLLTPGDNPCHCCNVSVVLDKSVQIGFIQHFDGCFNSGNEYFTLTQSLTSETALVLN